MQCPKCHIQVDETERFCQACGTSLTKQCLKCAGELRIGASFCPSCGTEQEAYFAERTAHLRQLMDTARQLADEDKHPLAINCAAKVLEERHEAFADTTNEAAALQKEWKKKRAKIEADMLQATSHASKAFKNGHYHEARNIIEAIPPSARDPELRHLYDRACERWKWLTQQSEDVRTFIRRGKYKEAKGLLKNVLKVCPKSMEIEEMVRQVDQRMKDSHLEKANAAIEREEYETAIELWKDALLEVDSQRSALVDLDAINFERDIKTAEKLLVAREFLAKNDLSAAAAAFVAAQEVRSINSTISAHIDAKISEIETRQAEAARKKGLFIALLAIIIIGVILVLVLVNSPTS